MKPTPDHPLRRSALTAAAAPSPSPWLPLPSALVPPKKRRVFQTPRKVTTPIPPPPPLRALASSAANASVREEAPSVMIPIPPPPADAAVPPPSAKQLPSPRAEIPSSPPRPPTADDKPPTLAAAKPATPRELRDYRRNTVPKRRISEAAARQRSAAAGVFRTGEECAVKASAVDQNAAFDGVLDEGQNSVEMAAKKPVADFSAVAACEEELFGKKKRASGGTLPGKPEDCDAPELGKPVSKSGEGMREVFVGGLDRDAKEADVRAALGKAGEITEVRMVMDAKANKNKGFCFVSYREAAQARKAIEEFGHVKICRSLCRVASLETNGKIFLGNIDKKWRKEDIMKLLHTIGVEYISTVKLKADCNKPGYNCGYAHIELETNRDARMVFRKLSRNGVFGRSLNITVEWATPSNRPDEKEMQKVFQDNPSKHSREKRFFSALGDNSSYCVSRNPRARYDSTNSAPTSSYGVPLHSVAGYSPYHQGSSRFLPDSNYEVAEPWCGSLMRQPGYGQLGYLHGNRHYQKY